MDPLTAASLLKMFLSVCDNGPGAIVSELVSMAIPGGDILTAAEILGIDLGTNSAVRRDPSLQRYLGLELDTGLDINGLDTYVSEDLDNE